MVQRPQTRQPQNIKNQYGEMVRWQRELLVAETMLHKIAQDQGLPYPENDPSAEHPADAEDRRLAYFQRLFKFNQEQHRQAHFQFKQERERLIRDIRTLHQLVAEAL